MGCTPSIVHVTEEIRTSGLIKVLDGGLEESQHSPSAAYDQSPTPPVDKDVGSYASKRGVWEALGAVKALGMPWVPVCNRGQGAGLCFISSVFFPRTIKTPGRGLIDSPIGSPMDA